MAQWLKRFLEDAKRRLEPPSSESPSERLARYKEYLRHESNRLKVLHRRGEDGREVCRARAAVLDLLLQHLVNAISVDLPNGPAEKASWFALVATGGYGRGELNPYSDIDILFLHTLERDALTRGRVDPRLRALTDGLLYTLWDVGLKVGHAVRTVEDCVQVANADMQSKTSLLEARFVAGEASLFRRMEAVFLARCVRGKEDAYLAARIADQEARRAKHGGSPTMQEPNIKNGCGGLRDYQNLLWMAFFKYRTRTLAELEERELISGEERTCLEDAYEFLQRVRNELHYEKGRAADALPRALQPRIAGNLGYVHRSPVRRLEEFMRDVYTHMRGTYLITRTLERRLALLPDPLRRIPTIRQLLRNSRRRIRRQVVDGFEIAEGQIKPVSPRTFRDQPRRLLRVFFHAQQRGLLFHPDLAQMIRRQLDLVDASFREDSGARETFLEILNQRGNVAPFLRAMHETGLLGRYLPEFEPLTCLVQHEFYHQYAADEHTLRCLDHLDKVWEAKTAPYQAYSELLQGLERPAVLYLALLLHDAGKAVRDGDHAQVGSQMVIEVARRLELDRTTTSALRLIIEHHLLMSAISQRRDLDDPAIIRTFANQVQTVENLKMLTLHTLADSLGTSEQLWNGFKDSLLQRLFRKAHDHMSGAVAFQVAEEKQRERLAAQVFRLVQQEVGEDELHAHFESMPPRYFTLHEVEEIATDLRLVHRFMKRQLSLSPDDEPLEPMSSWQNEPDRGCTTLRVCTWDRPGLFNKITGTLTASGLNILAAQIFTRTDSIILDTFSVVDARTGLPAAREERERFEKLACRVMTRDEEDLAALIARRPSVPPLYHSVEDDRIVTTIHFDNESSETCTVLDLETEDHVGLLYTVTRELALLGLDIVLARISTEKGAAVDSFYLTESGGGKVVDAGRQGEILRRLSRRIADLSRS